MDRRRRLRRGRRIDGGRRCRRARPLPSSGACPSYVDSGTTPGKIIVRQFTTCRSSLCLEVSVRPFICIYSTVTDFYRQRYFWIKNGECKCWIFRPSSTHSSNAHAQLSSGARCLIFGRTLCLLPYFMWANSEGSGETARMRRLAWAFAGRLCDKYHNLMSWLKCAIMKSQYLQKSKS